RPTRRPEHAPPPSSTSRPHAVARARARGRQHPHTRARARPQVRRARPTRHHPGRREAQGRLALLGASAGVNIVTKDLPDKTVAYRFETPTPFHEVLTVILNLEDLAVTETGAT